jgi:formate C-acetyltransferase
MWNNFERDKNILYNQHKAPVFSNEGLDFYTLKRNVLKIYENDPVSFENKGRIIKYILSNARVSVVPEDFFQDKLDLNDEVIIGADIRDMGNKAFQKSVSHLLDGTALAQELLYYDGGTDYSHTSPYWYNVLTLGLPGLKKRAENRDTDFYRGVVLAYEGAEQYLLNLSREARKQEREQERMAFCADALESLTKRAPRNFYEALQLIYLFYIMQSNVECSYVRAFGSFDMLLYPYYKRDLESGAFTKEQIRTLIKYFINKLDCTKVWANQPFTLCGTGDQEPVNELSYLFLEEFIRFKPVYTKIHIRYSPQIPADFILMICDSIRNNGNSFVFINNCVASDALTLNGQDREDTVDYGVVGCYEIYSQGKELPCTCNGRINLAKAVEAVIFNGEDALTGKQVFPQTALPETFKNFVISVKEYLALFANNLIHIINTKEKSYKTVHFAPFLSSTYDDCMEKGMDIYSGGAKYNSSSINLIGTATCADCLMAVKRLVYEEKRVTLQELKNILKSNWVGYEELRRYALSLPKYGNNIDEVDSFATDITDFCADLINGKENGHGGTYRLGTFSIDERVRYGEKTGATPDGRLEATPLSKNVCASNACDKNGATAHILSALKLNYNKVPNGTVFDLSLSHSQVSGDEGLIAIKATLDTFMKKGGFAIQYNVLNTKVLKEAQREPEKHSTLQIRLCGWNVLFNDLSKRDQDEFILQSEVL